MPVPRLRSPAGCCLCRDSTGSLARVARGRRGAFFDGVSCSLCRRQPSAFTVSSRARHMDVLPATHLLRASRGSVRLGASLSANRAGMHYCVILPLPTISVLLCIVSMPPVRGHQPAPPCVGLINASLRLSLSEFGLTNPYCLSVSILEFFFSLFLLNLYSFFHKLLNIYFTSFCFTRTAYCLSVMGHLSLFRNVYSVILVFFFNLK